MKRVHHISGIYISVFIVFHLINHLSSLCGIEVHIQLMDHLRKVYRFWLVEGLLVIAISVQVFSGVKLFVRKRKPVTGFFSKLQIWSGLYLAIFFLFHLSAVFGGRWILQLDTNFYFGSAGLNTFPFYFFFVPYYGLAVLSFFGHTAAIHSQKMKKSILGIDPIYQSIVILIIGALIMLMTLYGLTNGLSGIELPEEYNVLIGETK